MNIQLEESETKGTFIVEEGAERLAWMTFSKAGTGRIIIDHTEVSEKLKNKGAGKQLVEAAVQWARKQNLRIIPLCPFARSVFERMKDYGDVLD